VWSPHDAVVSVKKMRYMRRVHGVKIITGHDPIAWESMKQAPEYYD